MYLCIETPCMVGVMAPNFSFNSVFDNHTVKNAQKIPSSGLFCVSKDMFYFSVRAT